MFKFFDLYSQRNPLHEEYFSPIDDYVLIISPVDISSQKLGNGTFGIVYQGAWQKNSVAIKQLAPSSSKKAMSDLYQEAACHARLQHPNIVQFYGMCIQHETGKHGMVMEYMSQGSLYSILHSSRWLPWPWRISVARNIAEGLDYLHKQKMVHRDLKSLNILLDAQYQAKIADFGSAEVKVETQNIKAKLPEEHAPCTLRWKAPELFKLFIQCTEASDVFSFGMILYELSSQKIPFENCHDKVVEINIQAGRRPDVPVGTPYKFARILTQCWDQIAANRPSASRVLSELTLQ